MLCAIRTIYQQSSKLKFEFNGQNQILEFFLYIIYIYLNKNWKIYWSEQSFTGLGAEDRCYHENCIIYYFFNQIHHFLILLKDLYFFFLQEAESKFTLALQYNSKTGSYYVSRARTRYMLEVWVSYVKPVHIQWNLSKLNPLRTCFICMWNRQVFSLYRLN